MRRHKALEEVIVPVVRNLGYTFVGLEYLRQGKNALIRLYIDQPNGVTADDCGRVSRQVNAVLSVESGDSGDRVVNLEVKRVMKEDYILEVSSPGLDRILFTLDQFEEQIGKKVAIRLIAPIEGRKNFKGRIQSVQNGEITVLCEEKAEAEEGINIPFSEIDRARIVPEW